MSDHDQRFESDMRTFRPHVVYHPSGHVRRTRGVTQKQFIWAKKMVEIYNMRRHSGVRIPYPTEPA